MKQHIIFAFLAFLGSSTISAQKTQAKFQSTPIVIDGNNSEWGTLPRFYDTSTKLLYECRNDGEFMYFTVQAKESETQMKIMGGGLNIGVEANTKPKLKANIQFQKMENQGTRGERNQNGSRSNSNAEKGQQRQQGARQQAYLRNSNIALVEGFIATKDTITKGNESDFTYNVAWNANDAMIFEIRIPLSEMVSANEKKPLPKIQFTIHTKLPALERPSGGGDTAMQGRGGQGGGQRGSGGGRGGMSSGGMQGGGMQGGPGGGGQRGGMQGGQRSDMENMRQEQSFKYKTTLTVRE